MYAIEQQIHQWSLLTDSLLFIYSQYISFVFWFLNALNT